MDFPQLVYALVGAARLQLPGGQLSKAVEQREAVREALAPWFETVLLDLKAR